MAIKIVGTTVIDDTRKFIPLSIEASGTVGTAGSVLSSTGTGIQWIAGGGGGSGTFDTGITTSIYVSVTSGIGTDSLTTNSIFSGPGIAYSFPSTAGIEYIIESMHITNKSGGDLYLSGRHDFSGGANVPIANRIIIPYQGSLELLEQPRIANPSDILRLQALTGIGTAETGHDGGLDAFIILSRKNVTDYIGVGKTITSTDQEVFTSVTNPSVIQSISVANYNSNVDADVTVSIFRGGTVGGIATTGIRQGYLAYNLTIPKNSNVEICQKPKHLLSGDSILVTTTPTNSVGVIVAGKYIV
jgi:hypothetical protein